MKRLGLLGGMSWESSIEYERWINQIVRDRLGTVASADLIIRSFNFADIEALQEANAWDEAGELLADAARSLEQAGADALVLCTNTMHRVADQIQAAVSVPLLHIADATAEAARRQGCTSVGLLGTRYTMEQDFYMGRLRSLGLDVIVPDEPDRTTVHEVIYAELVRGIIDSTSKQNYLQVIDRLVARGAQGIIAGCTEIELLVTAEDLTVPYFPTARLHARAAAEFALR
ncbi:MAG: aspartate/glutamate racemase family protein [Candidatus Nanopelagicales bacterium]|nr:aspartate/glutamate racemase family protein [Candidatus Nanopelagicales bacterium]MCU0298551.1 aspartate/glutamate racemase family protein [Candidatus Nanopelagicales bacterium]